MPRARDPKPRTRGRDQTATCGAPTAASRRSADPTQLAAGAGVAPLQARTFLAGEDERRRLERDLHDGVQNELVALIVKLTLAKQDLDTSPARAGTLSELVAHAEAALHSVRDIAHGCPPRRSPRSAYSKRCARRQCGHHWTYAWKGPRPAAPSKPKSPSTFPAWRPSRTSQNTQAEYRVTLRFQHRHATLVARIADDGDGFDPTHTANGDGLGNILDRIQTLGGTVGLTSKPGRGTVLTISLRWPPRQR